MKALTVRSMRILEAGETSPTVEHIRSSLARGLPEFAPAIVVNDGTFVVCGSGPSLVKYAEEIKQERATGKAICAIKGAHDWLVEQGVKPDMFVSCEPRERPLKHPNDRTTYLIASRCPPSLFDQLKDREVVIWHSAASKPNAPQMNADEYAKAQEIKWEDLDLLDECNEWKGRFGVGGGTTSGLRAIMIGFLMGFRKFKLYGFDSCLANDGQTKRFSGENIGTGKKIDVIVGGRRFWCNGALAQQAAEFQKLYEALPNITIEAVGDGLIAEILKQRRLRGYRS